MFHVDQMEKTNSIIYKILPYEEKYYTCMWYTQNFAFPKDKKLKSKKIQNALNFGQPL